MDKQEAIRWLVEKDCHVTELDGEPFVIVAAWGDVEEVEGFEDVMISVLGEDNRYDWGYSDQFDTCSDCYNAIETQPSHYGWTPDYWINEQEGEILCGDCIRDDDALAEDYMESRIGKGCHVVDPKDYGFRLVARGLEYGLHEHQADDPTKIQSWASSRGLQCAFDVFPSQFYQSFDVYMRPTRSEEDIWDQVPYRELTDEEVEDIRKALLASRGSALGSDSLRSQFRQYPTPADNAKKGLRAMSKPYATVNVDDGTVKEFDTIEEYMEYHEP